MRSCARIRGRCMQTDARAPRSPRPKVASGREARGEVEYMLSAAMRLRKCLRVSVAFAAECSCKGPVSSGTSQRCCARVNAARQLPPVSGQQREGKRWALRAAPSPH